MISPDAARELLLNSGETTTTYLGTSRSKLGEQHHVGIDDQQRAMHTAVTGPTGQGKSNLLLSMALQDAQKTGLCFLNPKGGVLRELLAKFLDGRVDDVVYINPNRERCPAINLLEPETSPEMTAAERTHQQKIVVSATMGLFRRLTEDWGERWPRNLRSLLTAHAALNAHRDEQNTLMDVYQCVTDSEKLSELLDRTPDTVTRTQLEEVKGLSDREKRPLLRRLSDLIENRTVRNIIAQPESDVSFRDVLADQKIVLVDAQGGHVGDWAASIIGSVVLSRVWSATAARSTLPPEEHHPFHIFVDEVQEFVSEADHIRRMLSQCREFNVSITAATQYLSDLDTTMQRALMNNTLTKVVFSPGASEDLHTYATIMIGLSKEELTRLGQYRPAVQRPAEGSVPSAVVVDTYPPWDWEEGTAEERIEDVLSRYDKIGDGVDDSGVNLGRGGNAGGERHTALLQRAKHWFESEHGAEVRLLYQETGKEKPDGIIDFQDGHIAHLEAEASTLSKPERVIQNLRRAAEAGNTCIFIVEHGNASKLETIITDHGQKIEGDYLIYEATDHRLTEYGTGNAEDCPELEDNNRDDLKNFCLYREADGFCTEIEQPCVLTEP